MAEYEEKVRKILSQNGCSFERRGKGDHDIWYSHKTGKQFTVPRHKAEIPVGTLNNILKDAGLK